MNKSRTLSGLFIAFVLIVLTSSTHFFDRAFASQNDFIVIGSAMRPQGNKQHEKAPDREKDQSYGYLKALNRFRPTPKHVAIAKLLIEFNSGAMDNSKCLKFFQDMSDLGAGMQDVIGTKTLITNAAIDYGAEFKENFLGKNFPEGGTTVERALLVYRRQATLDAIKQVVREFAGKGGKHAVYLAEIGKWTTQADNALTFSGDIDFSFVSLDENLSLKMKERFDEIIKEKTNLDTVKFDSVCTAHGKATPDVYIGEHGRMYGDEAMRGGDLKPINLSNGTIGPGEKGAPIIDRMVKELACQKAQSGEVQPSTHSKEPGLSMEMVRHFNHDIVAPKIFDPIDSILKAAKYVDRSCDAMRSISGSEISDPKLAEFCKEITKCAKNSDFSKMAKLLDGYFGSSLSSKIVGEGQRPQAKLEANKEAIEKFYETCNEAMWKNAESGFRARLKEIDKQLFDLEKSGSENTAESEGVRQMRANMLSLLEMCKLEFAACESNHLTVPQPIHSLFDELKARIDKFTRRKGVKPLSDEEMKQLRFIENCIKSGKKPLIIIAMAYTVDVASKAIDKTNNILDYLDDTLLGSLRGDSPDFDTFVRETQAARLELNNPSKRSGALTRLTSLKSGATNIIRGANARMNAMIQSTTAGRGAMKGMQAVNLAQEVQAYYDSYNRDGYAGLAVEFFRRRVPGGGAVDAYYQENYLRTGVELVYMIFPPAAIPEGLYGMVSQGFEWSGGKLNQWKYDALVDELYEQASFQPGPNGFTLYKVRYECPHLIELSRAEAHTLPSKCPQVWQLIAPQIKYHPAVQVYEEMLSKKEVSSGRDSIFPYSYAGLNGFGERLQQAYRKQVDRVVEEYFKGVIEELERRRNFEGGETYKSLQEIQKALGCSKPLVSDSKDRKLIEELIADYANIKKTNALIVRLQAQYNANMLAQLKPSCSIASLKNSASWARFYASEFESALNDARSKVEARIGRDDPQFDQKAKPATRARLGMAWFSQRRPPNLPGSEDSSQPSEKERADSYFKWHTEFENELAKLDLKDLSIQIDCSNKAYVGFPWEATVTFDRANPKRLFKWEFTDNTAEKFSSTAVNYAKWVPSLEGKCNIRFSVKEDATSAKWTSRTVEVEVLSAANAPKLKVKLTAESSSLDLDEVIPIRVGVVEAIESDPFTRYFWFENGVQTKASENPVYDFSAAGKSPSVIVRVIARTGKGLLSEPAELKLTISGSSNQDLRCWIHPNDRNVISDGEALELTADVARKSDSGELVYQWCVDGTPVSNSDTFVLNSSDYLNRKVNITLYVQDLVGGKLIHEGKAAKQITVSADKLIVVLSGCPDTIGLGESLEVSIRSPQPDKGTYTYSWFEWMGRGYSSNSYGDRNRYTLAAREEGSELGLKVVVRDERGRVGEAETKKIKVVQASPKLRVSISPSSASIVRGTSMKLRVSIDKFDDSGLLTLNGVELGSGVTETTLQVAADKDDKASVFTVTADVTDEKGRKGSAFATLYLKDPSTPEKTQTTGKKPETQTTGKKPETQTTGKKPETQTTTKPPLGTNQPETTKTQKPTGGTEPTTTKPVDVAKPDQGVSSVGTGDKKSGSKPEGPKTGETTKVDADQRTPESTIKKILATLSLISTNPFYGQTIDIAVRLPSDVSVGGGDEISTSLKESGGPLNKTRPKDFATRFPGLTEREMDYVEALLAGDEKAKRVIHLCPVDEEYCPVCAYRAWLTEKPSVPEPVRKGKKLKKVIWHSEPALSFKNGTTSGASNAVTLDRMNKVKVWAQLEIDDDNKTIYAETDQIEIQVRAPKFKIEFEPSEGGKPGQEISAKVSESPSVADRFINFRWDMPASGNRFEVSKNARQIRLKLRDKDSYNLLVQPTVPYYADLIGGAISAIYKGGNYSVKATAEERGPKPMMWEPAKGLVEVPKGTFAVFEQVYLKASLEGEPKPDEIRWKWETNEGTTISNPISTTPTLTRSETGSAIATVTAKDKDGVLLGTQTVTVNFSISKDQLTAPLSVTLSADKSRIKSGESVFLRAVASGGKSPYQYSWKGRASTADSIQFTGAKPGDEEFSVQVKDDQGKTSSATLSISVEPAQLAVDMQVDRSALPMYEKAQILAKAQGGKPPYTYAWKGASTANENKAEFTAAKVGRHELSVDVTDSLGNRGNKSTTLNVAAPTAQLSFERSAVDVGQSSSVKISVNPNMSFDNLTFSWQATAGTVRETAPGVAVFAGVSAGSARVTVQVKDRKTNEILCESSSTILVSKAPVGRDSGKPSVPTVATVPTGSATGAASPPSDSGQAATPASGKTPSEPAGGWKIPSTSQTASASGQPGSDWKVPANSTAQTSPDWKAPTSTISQSAPNWKVPTASGAQTTTGAAPGSGWKIPTKTTPTKTTPTSSTQTEGGWKIPSSTSPAAGTWKAPASGSSTGWQSSGSNSGVTGTTTTMAEPSQESLAYVASFAGRWNSNWGEMTLSVQGTRVVGTYTHDNGRIEASLTSDGKTLTGVWLEAPTYTLGHDGGPVTMTISPDGNRLFGTWGYGKNTRDGDWTGTRIGPAKTVVSTKPTASATIPKARSYTVDNLDIVSNNPTSAFVFDLENRAKLDLIRTYHWNDGRGQLPGRIGLRKLNTGAEVWWQASGSPGQGGVANAYWIVCPTNYILSPGRYQVLDSHPPSWSQNAASKGVGITTVKLSPVLAGTGTGPSTGAGSTPSNAGGGVVTTARSAPSAMPVQINALLENRDTMPIHMWSHGENISPYNRVAVGGFRRRTELRVQDDRSILFWVGRNGQVIQIRRWSGVPAVTNNGTLRVIWDGRQIQFAN